MATPNNPSIPAALQPQYDTMVQAMSAGELDPLEFANRWAELKSSHALAEAERKRAALESLMANSAKVHISKRTDTTAGGRIVFSGGGLAMRSDNCTPRQFLCLGVNTGNVFPVGVATILANINGKMAIRETRSTRGENSREYTTYSIGDCVDAKPQEFVRFALAVAKELNVPIPEGFRSCGVLADGSDDPGIHRIGVDHID